MGPPAGRSGAARCRWKEQADDAQTDGHGARCARDGGDADARGSELAYAAQGTLIINRVAYENPSGCYPVTWFPSSITNRTNATATVWTGFDCRGTIDAIVYPGRSHYTEMAHSVSIR